MTTVRLGRLPTDLGQVGALIGLRMLESVGNDRGRGRACTVAMIVGLFAVAILAWAALGWAVYELIRLT